VIDEALTRFPGVHRRTDSLTYQFGLRVPIDLFDRYKSPWAVRCSLQTADLREANEKARQLQAQWAKTFEQQRAGKLPHAPQSSQAAPDLGSLRAAILTRLEIMLDRMDTRVAGYTSEVREERIRELRWCRDDTLQGLECGYLPEWQLDWLDGTSRSLGVPRSAVVDSELLRWYVSNMDIEIEALSDAAGKYPLRIGILAARRNLLPATQRVVAPRQPESAAPS
jgi:hypothetical protein